MSDDVEDTRWRNELTSSFGMRRDISTSEVVNTVFQWIGAPSDRLAAAAKHAISAVARLLPGTKAETTQGAIDALVAGLIEERAKNEALRAHTAGVVREQIAIALGVGPGASTDELIGVIGHLRGRLAAAEPKAVTIRAKVEIDETALREAVSRVLAERSERGAP